MRIASLEANARKKAPETGDLPLLKDLASALEARLGPVFQIYAPARPFKSQGVPDLAVVQELILDFIADPQNATENATEGCEARTHRLVSGMNGQGFNVAKIFVQGPLSPRLDRYSRTGETQWEFHAAVLLFLRLPDGTVDLRIVDPTSSAEPLKIEEWMEILEANTGRRRVHLDNGRLYTVAHVSTYVEDEADGHRRANGDLYGARRDFEEKILPRFADVLEQEAWLRETQQGDLPQDVLKSSVARRIQIAEHSLSAYAADPYGVSARTKEKVATLLERARENGIGIESLQATCLELEECVSSQRRLRRP